MQEDLDIKISMLLDGELESREALKILGRIRNESALRAKWIRYNVASCAFKEKSAIAPDTGFLDRVSKALDREAVIFNPSAIARKKLLIPSIAVALAASIALIAVVLRSGIPSLPGNPSNPAALAGFTQTAAPAPVLPVELKPAQTAALPKRFNDYLITHNESTYTTGAQTMMPYARVISNSYDR